jgi:hypothetical protein
MTGVYEPVQSSKGQHDRSVRASAKFKTNVAMRVALHNLCVLSEASCTEPALGFVLRLHLQCATTDPLTKHWATRQANTHPFCLLQW